MILPTKGVEPRQALITVGASILRELTEAKTVSRLWEEVRNHPEQMIELRFDWFILALDLLYAMGTIEYVNGQIAPRVTAEHQGGLHDSPHLQQ